MFLKNMTNKEDPNFLSIEEWESELERRIPGYREAKAQIEEESRQFGTNLCNYMERADMNSVELARESGLTAEAVDHFRTGEHRPQKKTVESFAQALGCSPVDLMPSYYKNQ
jgi:DNA-binding Xre family transcriptional regulator